MTKKNFIQMNWREILKYVLPALIGVLITTMTFILKEQRENKITSVQQNLPRIKPPKNKT